MEELGVFIKGKVSIDPNNVECLTFSKPHHWMLPDTAEGQQGRVRMYAFRYTATPNLSLWNFFAPPAVSWTPLNLNPC